MIEETEDGPRAVHYGFGLTISEDDGQYRIGHGGSWVAFTANYWRYPELETSIVAFCNSLESSAYDAGDQMREIAVDWATNR